MATVTHTPATATAVVDSTRYDHRVSWGALFAGLALFFAVNWLLLLLGTALGVGVADATDLGAIGEGLGIGAIIWMLITTLIATFTGALLAAKLAGSADDRVGALHGLTLWAISTLAVLLLGASGIGGAINAVSSAVSSGAQAGTAIVMGGTQAGGDAGGLPDSVTTAVAATVKRQAAKLVSETATGSASPEQAEVRSAIEDLSPEDVGAISSSLISGNPDQARQRLADRTSLSSAEIDSVITGVQAQIDAVAESEAAQQAEAWLTDQLDTAQREASQAVADMAGSEVSARDLRAAIRELDADILASVGGYLIQGKPERAKDVLVAETSLDEEQIDAIIDGAEAEVRAAIDEAQAELSEVTETIGTYAQAVLWAAFVASALGLVAGLFGGYMGASTIRRIYPAQVTVR